MSLLKEQINAIKYVGEFIYDLSLKHRSRKSKSSIELCERISQLMRHYPGSFELNIWHEWLVKEKGHE